LIAVTIGLSILSVNFAIAKRTHESGYGGMGYGGMGFGGTGPVIQEPVDTGNHHLDKAINKSTTAYRTHMRTHQL